MATKKQIEKQIGPPGFESTFNSAILTERQRRVIQEIFDDFEGVTVNRARLLVAVERQLGKQFVKKFGEGMVTYSDGKKMPLNAWASMYADTGAMNSLRSAQLDFAKANDMELGRIKVNPTGCQFCQPWDDQVVSLEGEHPDVPSLGDARAAKVFHPHCQCIVIALTPPQAAEFLGK